MGVQYKNTTMWCIPTLCTTPPHVGFLDTFDTQSTTVRTSLPEMQGVTSTYREESYMTVIHILVVSSMARATKDT